uniref:Glutathione synthetase n=1 Tax=Globodera rostochiensis TaxID=31243 RepID=A0A914H4P5_GLORO
MLDINIISLKFCLLILINIIVGVVTSPQPSNQPTNNNNAQNGEEMETLDVQALVEDAIDWAQNISLVWIPKYNSRGDVTQFVAFTLFPSPFPRKLFEQAQKLQHAYNLLYFRISHDYDFLAKAYEEVGKTNLPIRRLLNILNAVKAEGIKQKISLLLTRSDYMCHVAKNKENDEQHYELKQVEFNAGQIGGISVSRRIPNLHRRMMWKASRKWSQNEMPDSDGDISFAKALYEAWHAFGDPNAIILIVANKRSSNRLGQRHIEYEIELLKNRKVKAVRIGEVERAALLKDGRLTLDPNDFSLRMDGTTIAVVYQITDPVESEQTEHEAAAQLLIERSTAIKSPTVGLNLASQKKVQQLLAKPGMLEHFLPEPEYKGMIDDLRSTFAGLWDLNDNDETTLMAIKDAIANPEDYVLKPNMEGGGHNFWGKEIAQKLRTFTQDERAAHILMKRVHPMVIKNFIVRPGQTNAYFGRMTSELSIVGWLLGDAARDFHVLKAEQRGHFMRTKMENVNEGGISVGTGAFDSPYLI